MCKKSLIKIGARVQPQRPNLPYQQRPVLFGGVARGIVVWKANRSGQMSTPLPITSTTSTSATHTTTTHRSCPARSACRHSRCETAMRPAHPSEGQSACVFRKKCVCARTASHGQQMHKYNPSPPHQLRDRSLLNTVPPQTTTKNPNPPTRPFAPEAPAASAASAPRAAAPPSSPIPPPPPLAPAPHPLADAAAAPFCPAAALGAAAPPIHGAAHPPPPLGLFHCACTREHHGGNAHQKYTHTHTPRTMRHHTPTHSHAPHDPSPSSSRKWWGPSTSKASGIGPPPSCAPHRGRIRKSMR